MRVSAVICTRNRPDLIGQAVASVLTNTYPGGFELLVVDQSDNTNTKEIVQSFQASHENLRYIHLTRPGLSGAYNVGIREAKTELLAFTDDDCLAPPDWIASIAAAFDRAPDADLLYGQVKRPAALAHAPEEIPTLEINSPARLSRRDGFRIYGMGANFAARRRLFDRIGGFDEILGGGGPLRSSQDFDLQYRAYRAGAVTLLSPEVTVDHYGVRSAEQWPATLEAYGIGDGAFYSKHIRCGDWFALGLLLRRLGRLAVREAVNGIRRKPSLALYLRSCLTGIRAGLKYPVDRQSRLYLANPRSV